MISDETQIVQFGNSVDREFNSFVDNITPQYSSWSNFPTDDNPLNLYKFASFEVNLNKDLV